MLPKITDYWDTLADAVQIQSLKLAKGNGAVRKSQVSDLKSSIAKHVDALSNAHLAVAAYIAAEDLYKTVANLTEYPEEVVLDYLQATAGTFFQLLQERGFILRHFIDNEFEENLGGPINLFPEWYDKCGLLYICPQEIAFKAMQSKPDFEPADIMGKLPNYVEEGWKIAKVLVQRCEDDDHNYVFLIANASATDQATYVNERYDAASSKGLHPIFVFRDKAAKAHTRSTVKFPDHLLSEISNLYPKSIIPEVD